MPDLRTSGTGTRSTFEVRGVCICSRGTRGRRIGVGDFWRVHLLTCGIDRKDGVGLRITEELAVAVAVVETSRWICC